jgi:transposase
LLFRGLTPWSKEISQQIMMLPANLRDKPSLTFCSRLREFMTTLCQVGHKRNSGEITFSKARKKKRSLQRRLNSICSASLKCPDAENLRQRLSDPDRHPNRIFTFLDVNGMQPTNNHAEQSLRLPVIFRKITFGNRSALGAATFSTNLSLITTATRQNLDPIPFLITLMLSGPSAALPLLYRNPLPDT